MTIKEGMAIMSYDYKVESSTTKCLFNMQESKLKLEAKKLEKQQNNPLNQASKSIERMIDLGTKLVVK